jgi:hypothetical protein
MTTKETSTKGQPVPVPKEPPELIARRGKLLGELENQQKSAAGTVKACMVKMVQVFKAMEPGTPLDEQLYQDFKDAFVRLAKDPAAIPVAPIFMECVEYMQARIAALAPQFQAVAAQHNITTGQPAPTAAAAAPTPAPAPTAPAAPKGAGDGFESGAASRKPMSLGGDAPVAPPSGEKQDKQEELESFKNWMKNPGLGKMKG